MSGAPYHLLAIDLEPLRVWKMIKQNKTKEMENRHCRRLLMFLCGSDDSMNGAAYPDGARHFSTNPLLVPCLSFRSFPLHAPATSGTFDSADATRLIIYIRECCDGEGVGINYKTCTADHQSLLVPAILFLSAWHCCRVEEGARLRAQ